MNVLTKLRLAAGFETQQALADESGVAMQTISRFESGKVAQISNRTLSKLAPALKMSLEDLHAALSPVEASS